jgi:hypothetical protein
MSSDKLTFVDFVAAPIDGMITVTITLKQQRDSNLAYLGLYMCKWGNDVIPTP